MKKFLPKLILLIVFFYFSEANAQSRFSHELGVFFGPAAFQTDFGHSSDFASASQTTMAYGISFYTKFFGSQYNWRSGSSYFSEHFKLKVELAYFNKTNVTHEGVDPDSPNAAKLEAMTGQIKLYNAGLNLEYYFLELEDYSSFYRSSGTINPFIFGGLHYSYSSPDIFVDGVSLKGQEEPHTGLIDKWQEDAVYLDPQHLFSAAAGAGVRFGLDKVDFSLEGSYRYFFSDEVEGLNAKDDPANKNNDSMVFINAGIVYVFGKY